MMKKNIAISLFTISAIFMMAGCGSSATDDKKVENTKTPTPNHHIGDADRTVGDEYMVPNGLVSTDNKEGLKIFSDDTNYYIVYEHNNQGKNIQFFLDTDNNSNTGIKDEGGADLIVENGQLYVANGRELKELKKYSGSKEDIAYYAGKTKDSLVLSKNLLKNSFFGVKAETLNDKFIAISSSPSSLAKSYHNVDMNSYEALKDKTAYLDTNNLKLTLINNGNAVDMLLTNYSTANHVQLFIDADNNSQTGKIPVLTDKDKKLTMWDNMGADYLITEKSRLFKYNSTEKDWDYLSDVPYMLRGSDIIMQMQNSELQNLTGTKIKFSVITYDANWKIKDAAPKINQNIEIPEYSL